MKYLLYSLFALLFAPNLKAQNAQITLKMAPEAANFSVSLVTEKVKFQPSPAIGLADVEFLNIGYFEITNQKVANAEVELSEPQLVRLQIIPTAAGAMPYQPINPCFNRVLFISPNDKLTVTIHPNKSLTFEGTNAHYQEFLRDYFKENLYEYLPVFGYKPTKNDNSSILPKVDSLQQARLQRLQTIKSQQPITEAFDAYITATINTEAYLTRQLVLDKKIRESQGIQLKSNQRQEIENLTLQNFKILPDAALMSEQYRRELANYILIPITKKYPTDSAQRYILSSEALQLAYQESDEQLRDYPKQRAYLLSHWVDYAVTFRSDMTAAHSLLEKFERTYPSSELIPYFKQSITAKEGMYVGKAAPNFSLKDREGKEVTLQSLQGKPICIAFCFNLKQHELIFKPLEEAYKGRLTFVYLNVTPSTSFELWQSLTENRPNVVHLWGSDEDAKKLKETYATTMGFPFVVIDAQGKIVERWIPQEFPDNKTLQKELSGLVKK